MIQYFNSLLKQSINGDVIVKNEFIQIGNTRIKRSNIKSFGTSLSKTDGKGFATCRKQWSKGSSFLDGLIEGYLTVTLKYLFVTTYQNDNYKFSEDEIDIDEALKQLEGK